MNEDFIAMAVQSALGEKQDSDSIGRVKLMQAASRSLDKVNKGEGNAIDYRLLDDILGGLVTGR